MSKIIAFKDLEEQVQNIILRSSMTADFDTKLSFGIVDKGTLLGYSLLKPESIGSNIKVNVDGFDKTQYACRVIELKGMDIYNPHIISELCKKTIDRVQIWNDVDKGRFRYLWAIPKDTYDVNYMSNCLNCEQEEYLENEFTKKTLIYNVFCENDDEE